MVVSVTPEVCCFHPSVIQKASGDLVKSESKVAQSGLTLCDPMDCSLSGSSVRGTSGKSAGVDCHFLLQGIFSTQGSNPGLPHCGQMLYRLSHQGSLVNEVSSL